MLWRSKTFPSRNPTNPQHPNSAPHFDITHNELLSILDWFCWLWMQEYFLHLHLLFPTPHPTFPRPPKRTFMLLIFHSHKLFDIITKRYHLPLWNLFPHRHNNCHLYELNTMIKCCDFHKISTLNIKSNRAIENFKLRATTFDSKGIHGKLNKELNPHYKNIVLTKVPPIHEKRKILCNMSSRMK